MTYQELIQLIEKLKNTMVSVSTGGQHIQAANPGYQEAYSEADIELRNRNLENPNPYSDLWEWYGRWSSGDLPTYQSRRQFLAETFSSILQELRNRVAGKQPSIPQEPTGWPRVDRTIGLAILGDQALWNDYFLSLTRRSDYLYALYSKERIIAADLKPLA